MANTLSGFKLYISPTASANDLTQSEFEALADWVEVKQIGSLGQAGVNQNIVNYNTLDTDVIKKAKGLTDGGSQTVECARDYDDAGQVQMRAAAATNFNYPIRLVGNDAPSASFTDTVIYNRGLVVGPSRPGGSVEDFDLEVFTIGYQQKEIVVDPATV